MSIKNWLIKKPLPVTEGLPDQNKCSSIEQAKNCVSANAEISLISSPKPHGNKIKESFISGTMNTFGNERHSDIHVY